MNTTTKAKGKGETLRLWAFALLVLLAGGLFTLGMGTANAAPAAGTVIGNQATASYTDATNTGRTATSNLVQTTVSQVNSFTLTANGARTGAPGQTVYYPHTITNTGNGADTYNLTAPASGTFGPNTAGSQQHGGLAYYIDANGDGLPDNATPITTTGPIAAGGIFRFVVAGTVPAGAVNGDTATITVAAVGTAAPLATPAPSNTDTTTVAASVITVTKSLSSTSGPAGVTLTVTLSYTNSGTVAASNLTLTDNVGTGGFTYVAGSGRWSVTGASAMTDATGPGDPGAGAIDYSVTGSTVTAIIANVGAGISGNVTFQVQVPATRAPGFMPNTATYQTASQAVTNTNTSSYQVLQTASVVANGSTTSSLNAPAAAAAEPVTVATAAAGTTVTFHNIVWNKGNAADSFVISMSGQAGWPAGSTFNLYQSDGVTSLISNTTPSIPAYAGASCGAGFYTDAANGGACGYDVVLKVVLPANASGGPYTITKTARSSFDNTKSDTVDDTLSAITANTVDITNNAPSGAGTALGTGAGTATVLVTNTVTPSPSGSTAVAPFRVYVTNTGAVSDSFNLAVTSAVPAGWSVQFLADGGANDCSTVGTAITSTGALAAGANRLVCAVVTVPSTVSGNAGPGTTNFTFRAQSATNAAVQDTLVDAVTVNTVNNVTLTPNNTQQTFPGGSVTYSHVVTNNGNVTETISWNALTDSRSGAGWTSAGYVDANGNGSFDTGTDDVAAQLIPGGANASFTLAPGATRTVFVRVFAPGSATAADPANVTTITAKFGTGGSLTTSATDTTSVTDGLVLTKTQGTVNCTTGAQVLAQTSGSLPAQPPGTCIKYQVTGQNTTAANITSVVINDNVPGSTAVLTTACATTTSVGSVNAAANTSGFTGTVTATVGTLTPSQQAVVTFCVQIAP